MTKATPASTGIEGRTWERGSEGYEKTRRGSVWHAGVPARYPELIVRANSSNDVAGFHSTVELCPREFAVMTGNGTVLLDALRAGATGAILAVGCVVPEVCVEIFRLFTDAPPSFEAVTTSFT